MFNQRCSILFPALIVSTLGLAALPLHSQLGPPSDASYGGAMPHSEKVIPGIAWYGVLEEGLKEAKRTNKPIFFVTAAPQCGGVPGMW